MSTPDPSPICPLLEILAERTSCRRAMDYVVGIWRTDRWFTNPKFLETHRWAAGQMLAAGADEAEIVEIPADGRARFENWIMPRAWDCRAARLEVVSPTVELLADRDRVPQCVVQWCGPTPPEGVVAPLISDESLNPSEAGAARGRIVLTAKSAREVRNELDTWQAAAVVSCFLPDYIPDRSNITCWTNAWSTKPGGWAVHAGEPEMCGFNLPPEAGARLAKRLAAGEQIVVRVRADTRLYDGILPVSTALVRGTNPEQEVLLLGHAAEVGANDNASGCAAMMEALGVLAGLIRDGRLPRPRRSMRILLTSEIYGLIGYAGLRDSLARTIAGLHFDIVGDGPGEGRPIVLFEQGPSNPTYANELIGLINRAMPATFGGPDLPFERRRYTGVADDMIGDPAFGVPCPWMGRPVKNNPNYHSSGDTPDTLNPAAVGYAAATGAAYLYFIASAGNAEAEWLADQLIARARNQWVAAPADDAAHLANYRLKAEALRAADLADTPAGRDAVADKVRRALPGADEPIPYLADTPASPGEEPVVSRVTRGVLSFQGRDPALLARYPHVNWDQKVASALYWADGRRTIAQLRRLAEAEWAAPIKTDLADLFAAAASCGMVRLTGGK